MCCVGTYHWEDSGSVCELPGIARAASLLGESGGVVNRTLCGVFCGERGVRGVVVSFWIGANDGRAEGECCVFESWPNIRWR